MMDIRRLLEDMAIGYTASKVSSIKDEVSSIKDKVSKIEKQTKYIKAHQLKQEAKEISGEEFSEKIMEELEKSKKNIEKEIQQNNWVGIDKVINKFNKFKFVIFNNFIVTLAEGFLEKSNEKFIEITGAESKLTQIQRDQLASFLTDANSKHEEKGDIESFYKGIAIILKGIIQDKEMIKGIENMKEVLISFGNADIYLHIGKLLSGKNIQEKAVYYLEQAKKCAPENIEIISNLTLAQQMSNQHEKAIKEIDGFISQCPDNVGGYFTKGFLLFTEGKYKEAREIYEYCLNKFQDMPPLGASSIHFDIAKTIIKLNGNDSEIIYELKRALELNSSNSEVLIELAKIYIKQEKYNDAFELFKKAESLGNMESQILLGEIYIKNNKLDDAYYTIKKYLEKYPDSLKAHQLLFEVYQKQNNQEMIKEEQKMILNIEKQEKTKKFRSEANECIQKKEMEKAIKIIEEGLQIEPYDTYLLTMGIGIYGVLKNWEKAKKMLEILSQIKNIEGVVKKTLENLNYLIGIIYFATDNINNAREYFEKALNTNTEANFYIGWYFYKDNKTEKALDSYYKHIIEKKKDDKLSYINDDLCQYEQKMKCLFEYMVLQEKAWDFYYEHNVDKAISILEEIIKRDSQDKFVYHNLSFLYRKKGKGIFGIKKEWKDKINEIEDIAKQLWGLEKRKEEWVRYEMREIFECKKCEGSGYLIELKDNCPECDGTGYKYDIEKIIELFNEDLNILNK